MSESGPGDPNGEAFRAPEPELPPFEAQRQELVSRMSYPYQRHFAPGSEGERVNPTAAEHTYDATLATIHMIQTKQKSSPGEPAVGCEWYYDKYPGGDRNIRTSQPRNIVRSWLGKLGSHNDMAGAENDLVAARTWLIDGMHESGYTIGGTIESHPSFPTIVEIDRELSLLLPGEEGKGFLDEATRHAEHAFTQSTENGNYAESTRDRAQVAFLHIEQAKQAAFGSRALINQGILRTQYGHVQATALQEIAGLRTVIETALETLGSDPEQDTNTAHMGLAFESIMYYRQLAEIINTNALMNTQLRPATLREEGGSSNFSMAPGSRQKPPNDFNFNADLVYTVLPPDPDGQGINMQKTYLQLKLSGNRTTPIKLEEAQRGFLPQKRFIYVLADRLIGTDAAMNDFRREARTVAKQAEIMRSYLHRITVQR